MTSFRTEEGQFQFCRMPFGLMNAPASFQRLMNVLFANLKGPNLQVFIDDICLASRTWVEHCQLLEEIFKLLIEANLKLKASKCIFGSKEVIFLGHRLSKDGIQADPEKLRAIENLPRPKSVDDVRRILGLMNYYRRLVPNFAHIVAPLTKCLKKGIVFNWDSNKEKAFNEVKNALMTNPILANFNHQDPLALKTDASTLGVAGILLQRQQDEWKLISCASRRLSIHEENYGISELEALAIVYSVSKFRNYLLGKHFSILTDHCALCSLKSKMPASARLRRWAILLSEYDFEIRYLKGSKQCDVDCLSRAPVDQADDQYLESKVLSILSRKTPIVPSSCCIVIPLNRPDWKRESETDSEGSKHFKKARNREKGYKIINGLLYYENRLFVPKTFRQKCMLEAHNEIPAAHGGIKATLYRLKDYWWENMSTDLGDFIKSCDVCQKNKSERLLPAGTMQSFNTSKPFELVAVDCLGPMPSSLSLKKHVFVAIDCFTRFIDAEASEDVQCESFTNFFRNYIGRFGSPVTILSDNAPTFSGKPFNDLMNRYNINIRKSTPHHHEGNSIAERAIQSLKQKIINLTHDPSNSLDWEKVLPDAVLSVNTSYHDSTGISPFELLFGIEYEFVARCQV